MAIEDELRVEQTMLRVADLDAALDFYILGFGMRVLARDLDAGARTSSALVGYAGVGSGAPVELVADWDAHAPYTHGTGYGHVAIGVADVPASFARLEAMGAEVILPPGVVTPGGPCCAFVKDRDGYAIELVETRDADSVATGFDPDNVILGPADGRRRILHTMLRIGDVDRALHFYVDGLGMRLLERVDIEFRGGVTGLFVGYDAAEGGRMLELSCYRAATEPYTHGTGFGHVAVRVPDLAAACARLVALGFPCALAAGDPRRATVRDPDGHAFLLTEG